MHSRQDAVVAWTSKPGALKVWRERACLTVQELAKESGISVRTIYALESDKPRVATIETLTRLVDVLKNVGCTIRALATHSDDGEDEPAEATADDASAPELGTLSRRARRERQFGLHQQALRSSGEVFDLLGLDRFKRCLSRPHAHDGKRFALHGTVDEYMGIPPAARKILKCKDGGRFRIIRTVAPGLLFYTTVYATTTEHANALEAALEGSPISLLVRLLHAPPDGAWTGFYWFEKTPKPREFAYVLERFLEQGEVLKELPPILSKKG